MRWFLTAFIAALTLPLASCSAGSGELASGSLTGPSVSENGFTLTSERIGMQRDEAPLPDGPGVRVTAANCMACHSAGMILTQPKLSEKQWIAIVEKMRTAYKAPVADADVPAIVAYLGSLSANQ